MMRYTRYKSSSKKIPALIAVVLILAIGAGMLALYRWESEEKKQEAEAIGLEPVPEGEIPELKRELLIDGESIPVRNGIESFLILGLDKFEEDVSDPDSYNNNQQSDFILLMVLDNKENRCSGVLINRDTMADIPRLGVGGARLGTKYAQIALAYNYGSGGRDSCRNTAEAVSKLLYEVPIDHYASFTMDAVSILNDMVGGVTVWIGDDFSDANPSLIQGTWMKLSGKQALSFIRSRMSMQDSSNLARMKRQREYLNALYEQAVTRINEDGRFAWKAASELEEYTVSDLTVEELSVLVERIKNYTFQPFETISGEARKGDSFMEFYPDEDALKTILKDLFC